MNSSILCLVISAWKALLSRTRFVFVSWTNSGGTSYPVETKVLDQPEYNEWMTKKCKMQTKSSGLLLLQNVPHKNSTTYCDENYNTSSSFAKEVVSLLKSTNDKRNIQFFFQHPSLKKPHHITTLWFSEVVNYHPNFLYQICTD